MITVTSTLKIIMLIYIICYPILVSKFFFLERKTLVLGHEKQEGDTFQVI